MHQSKSLYFAAMCLMISVEAGYWWVVSYSGLGECDSDVSVEATERLELESINALIEPLEQVGMPMLTNKPLLDRATVEEQTLELPDRFPNESLVRGILNQLKGEVMGDTLSAVAYQAYLLGLEELLADAAPHYAEVWSLIQSELGSDFLNSLESSEKGEKVLAPVERKFGFVWEQADPEQSLHFARQAGAHVLSGWLSGQIVAENDPTALLAAQHFVPSPEIYWEALMGVAKTDTIRSLDSIVENHMDEITLEKWKEILFSKGNSDEPVLAEWFQANIEKLSSHPDFDKIEVIGMLRR